MISPTCALYGATIRTSAHVDRPPDPVAIGPRRAAVDERPREAATASASTGDSLSAPVVGTSSSAARRRRRSTRAASTRWTREMRLRLEPVVVEDLRGECAQVGMQPPGRLEEEAAVGGIVAASPSTWASADRSAPGGWVPCSGWSSCCGSPSRTRLSVARAIATTLASEIWPASSTNRTSTASIIFERRPQPRRSGGEVRAAVVQPGPDVRGVLAARRPAASSRTCSGVAALDRADVDALGRGGLEDGLQEVADDLVARRR